MEFNFGSHSSPSTRGRLGCGGRVFLTLFGLAFFGMGALFIGLILQDVRKDAQTRNWAPTECTILESGVVPEQDANGGSLFSVCYAWRAYGGADAVDGQQHTGTTYSPGHSASRDYRDAAVLAEQFPAGSKATCYVNPANLLQSRV
jgi:uncharacterized protein DUF3592